VLTIRIGVILAAGRGSRMGLLGEDYPKALLPVANEPLVSHHLGLLRDLGVQEVYLVVGYRSADVMTAVGDGERYGLKINYVEQESILGSAHALVCLRSRIREPFLLVLGDYYFSASDPACLLRRLQNGEGSAISAKREPDRDLLSQACELKVDKEGRVLKIVEKPMTPKSDLKGCGFYALRPEIFDAIARTPRTALRNEYELSNSLELYVEAGSPLYAEEMITWDFNFTWPEDLLECNLKWLEREARNDLIAKKAQIEPGTHLEHVIIGDHARVTGCSSLEDVVIFPGATLEGTPKLRRALVTPKRLYVFNQQL
jgi:NDP-sugar pyrophosphorylase family protein